MYVHATYPRTSAEIRLFTVETGAWRGVTRCRRRLARMGQAASFEEEASRRMVSLLGEGGVETIGRPRT